MERAPQGTSPANEQKASKYPVRFCNHCKVEHPLTAAHWHRLDGSPKCKVRTRHTKQKNYDPAKMREYNRAYRAEHHERLNEENRKWREANKEQHRAVSLEWYYANRSRARKGMDAYKKARRKTDPAFRLACNLRGRMYRALVGLRKTGSAIKELGCSTEELRAYLEAQFVSGMTWDNYGSVWEVDHILPLANYQLEDRGTFRRLVHYTNLQPLLVADNRRKKNLEDVACNA